MEGPSRPNVGWPMTSLLLVMCASLCILSDARAEECYLSKGRCIYHVELSPNCQNKGSTKDNRVDYLKDQKMNEIEQTMVDVHDNHARRIADLENRISQLISRVGQETIRVSPPGGGITQPDYNNNSVEGGGESRLLDLLQKEFSGIRTELLQTGRRVRSVQRQLDVNKLKLNKTETALLATSRKLLITEGKYHDMRGDRDKQKRSLRQTNRELNSTKTQLSRTLGKLKKREGEALMLRGEKKSLTADLIGQKELLESTQAELASSRTTGQESVAKLTQTTQELGKMETELNTCYSAKTTVFCGFEDESMCGFINENTTDSYDWTRHHGSTSSRDTGPAVDHTCGNTIGYYLYVEATRTQQGQRARMKSPTYRAFSHQCVSFYYHMYGYHIGTLNVFAEVSPGQTAPIWRAYGNQGNVWIRAYMEVPEQIAAKGFSIVFEAILGNGYQGDMAVDDFHIADGRCHTPGKPQDMRLHTRRGAG